jgi:hypothetical protein
MHERNEAADEAVIDRDGEDGADRSPIVRIEDRRDDLLRKLETAWRAALSDLFTEPRAA